MTGNAARSAMALGAGVQRLSTPALALVLLAHAGLFFGLLSVQSNSLPVPKSPLMMELFQGPVAAPKAPAVAPQKPDVSPTRRSQRAPPSRPQPPVAPTVLATEGAQAAPSLETARPEKAAAALAATVAAPQPAATSTSTATAPAAATATLATAPRFDAAYLDNPAPVYPPQSRRAGEEGRVLLHVLVEASGMAAQVELRSSSGFERLDRAALAAVRRWRFVPARQGGEAVAAWVLVPIVFGLKG